MTTGPSQGMNLGGAPTPYQDGFFVLDLMKGMERWYTFVDDKFQFIAPADQALDAKGWLTELPVIDGAPRAAFTNVLYTQALKPGTYILEWDGKGDIGVYQNARLIAPNKLEITFDADYFDDQGRPKDDGFTVIINSTDPNNTGDYIRNIRLYDALDADLINAGEKFDPVWQDRIDDFRVLRMHGWQNTNFPTAVDWERNVFDADQAGWGYEDFGMPYENLLQMANETRSDLWINIPHTASDQYIREAAKYLKANLDGDLRLHVEFSNEYWTEGFDQHQYFVDGGRAAFGTDDYATGQFYGTRAARMADIFTSVFGAQNPQLMPVLTVDNVFFLTGEAEAVLTSPSRGGPDPVSRGFDSIATDGYLLWQATDPFFSDQIDQWLTDADGGFGRARDFLLAQLREQLLPSWQEGRKLADKYGLDFMVYEGGALLLNTTSTGGDGPQKYTDFAAAFSKSTEMKEVYVAMIAAWKTVGTGPFAWFADGSGKAGAYGDFAHWKGPDFIPDPRTGAFVDANGDAPWWGGDNRPDSTFDNGIYRAGTARGELMNGAALDDRLYGLAGSDTLNGRAGDDRLWSGLGRDSITGGEGLDTLNGGAGADRLAGGAGRDTADYRDSAAGVVVNLATGVARGGYATGDVLSGIESLRGSAFADVLTGTALANSLAGAQGADVLRGLAGNDMLCGGQGADTLTGGAGNDAFVYRSIASGGDTITDFGATAGNNDVIRLLATAFGDHATGALRISEFQVNTAGLATKPGVRVIYDSDHGRILYDADGSGNGRAVLLATVQDGATITASDFLFV